MSTILASIILDLFADVTDYIQHWPDQTCACRKEQRAQWDADNPASEPCSRHPIWSIFASLPSEHNSNDAACQTDYATTNAEACAYDGVDTQHQRGNSHSIIILPPLFPVTLILLIFLILIHLFPLLLFYFAIKKSFAQLHWKKTSYYRIFTVASAALTSPPDTPNFNMFITSGHIFRCRSRRCSGRDRSFSHLRTAVRNRSDNTVPVSCLSFGYDRPPVQRHPARPGQCGMRLSISA